MRDVLSLFDGISVGRLALEHAGIAYERYYASEIDPAALKVAVKNYPDTVPLGDVTKWREWPIDWGRVDLLIGGSPCQGFSFAGKQLGFEDPRSRLLLYFVEVLEHVRRANPNVQFLLENVRMKKGCKDIISHLLGVEPVLVDSALVSAQSRKRLYWVSWPFPRLHPTHYVVREIMDGMPYPVVRWADPRCVNSKSGRAGLPNAQPSLQDRIYSVDGKMPALTATANPKVIYPDRHGSVEVQDGYGVVKGQRHRLSVPNGRYTIRKLSPVECERLQTLPDGYTGGIADGRRVSALGNGWTMEVIKHILSYLPNQRI